MKGFLQAIPLQLFPVLSFCLDITQFPSISSFYILEATIPVIILPPSITQLQILFLASDTHYFHLSLRALSGRPCFIFFFTYSPSVPGYHFYFTHSILLFHYSSVLEDVDDSSVLLLIDRVLNNSQMHCLPSNPCSSYLAETKQVSFI